MTKIPSVEERVAGYRTEIEEAVIATYPVDLFPDNETAKTLRVMAPAIASIVSHVIERAVEEAEQRCWSRGCHRPQHPSQSNQRPARRTY